MQLLKLRGASFVAATSTQTDLMRTLGVDRPIDYRQENVWELPEFQSAEDQFDLVFDLAAGGWENGVKSDAGRAHPIIKSGSQGGRFIATVGRTKWFDAHSWFDIAKVFVFPTITKMASTWLMRWNQPRLVHAEEPMKTAFRLVDISWLLLKILLPVGEFQVQIRVGTWDRQGPQ